MGRKIFSFIVWIILSVGILTGCGATAKSENEGVSSDYYIVETEIKELIYPEKKDDTWQLLGTQFYHDGAISLWGVEAEEGFKSVFLGYEDGTCETLLENVATIHSHEWYYAQDGSFYVLSGEYIVKLGASGEEMFCTKLSGAEAYDICQLSDGSVMLLVRMEDGTMKLAQLNSENGDITAKSKVALQEEQIQFISGGENGLLLADSEGVWEINFQDGSRSSLLSFESTAYNMDSSVADFRVAEDGSLKLLLNGNMEIVSFVNVAESRTIITVRNNQFQYYMQSYADQFNKSNDIYYVVLEERDEKTALADFRERTNVEIGTGGGADIIYEDAMNDAESLLEKGAFEDLRPYLEASGMSEEEFFPAAFEYWKEGDKLYSVNILARSKGIWMSRELLGDIENPDMETLLNALMNYQEKAVFKLAWGSDQVLDYFLAGSEDLWGMLDWANGTCDFDGELFAKMLETAKRYGYDEKQDYPALAEFRMDGMYSFEYSEQLEAEGKVYIGYIFEDGCYPAINQTGVMAINANSDEEHKQGAWEFIKFLLQEELQSTISVSTYPVNKNAFEIIAAREVSEGSVVEKIENGVVVGKSFKAGSTDLKELGNDIQVYKEIHDLKEEQVTEIRSMLESSRSLPTRAEAIKAIIYEEAAEYFAGTKGIGEVISVIENRVQLYLRENE